jgi:hypothetical protein
MLYRPAHQFKDRVLDNFTPDSYARRHEKS